MTALRDKIIRHTIEEFEGGLSNHKSDTGGLTKYGITKGFYAEVKGIKKSEVHDDNIRNLTLQDAIGMYEWLWAKANCDYLPSVIQHIYFDMCVNHGRGNAGKIIQRTAKAYGYDTGRIDGSVGPKTIHAISQALGMSGPDVLLETVVKRRLAFYEAIVYNNPTQKVFLKGWKNRANWFLTNRLTIDPKPVYNEPKTKEKSGFMKFLSNLFKGE